MEYEELNSAWKTQREQYQLWEMKLLQYARHLREHVEQTLSLSEKSWVSYETKEEHRYVELVDFFEKVKPIRTSPCNTSITSDGFLAFGISITFAHEANSYPKQNIFVPIAIRFNKNDIEHAFFDTESNSVTEGWTLNKEDFCIELLKKLHDYLSHDPHDGFGLKTKRRIGFLD